MHSRNWSHRNSSRTDVTTGTSTPRTAELEFKGVGVSPGIAIGAAFIVAPDDDTVVMREITVADVPRELQRFENALVVTRQQIHDLQHRMTAELGQESAQIFEAHLLMLEDRAILDEVVRVLKTKLQNIEFVVQQVAERYTQALLRLEDDYLRERAVDVRDIARRLLRNLAGHSSSALADLDQPCIVIAHDLSPSETAGLNREKVLGFATDLGSPTSHTAIMARALGIPAVVGMHDISLRVAANDAVLVDGQHGQVFIQPARERLERYERKAKDRRTIQARLTTLRDQPARTRDGYDIPLAANIEQPSDVDSVLTNGAVGIGLYRTEFLFVKSDHLPTEDEQAAAYEDVARRVAPYPAIIRTMDIGGDKFVSHLKMPQQVNPFMGWRAIRFCLAQPDIFKTQLRAILRASTLRNVKIMYPMISNVKEVIEANRLLAEAKTELAARSVAFDPDIEVGVMIEVPSAALTADLIAPHIRFFSIGTNDLVQYTLAVDRVNELVTNLYEPTHPAILKLIKNTIDVGHEHGLWTGVCGEMGGNPLLVPLLIGLGIDELSINAPGIPLVKDVIRSLRFSQAEELAQQALRSGSAEEVLANCRALVNHTAPEILELVE
ncbi:MAG: phosphoenolpyruvate--protein phosphotransferase [Verrucomicrobia bacterium]|nr:MAG: phosphoenolpyruvate--protein phosphotransferase [Verrucomicrobiota bacterium]